MFLRDLKSEWNLRKKVIARTATFNKLGYEVDEIGRLYKVVNYPVSPTTNISDIHRKLVEEQTKLHDFLLTTDIFTPEECIPVIERLDNNCDDKNESYVIAIYPCYNGEAFIIPDNLTKYTRRLIAGIVSIPIIGFGIYLLCQI